MLRSRLVAFLALLAVSAACPPSPDAPQLPNATASGYLEIEEGIVASDRAEDSQAGTAGGGGRHASPRLFFLFYEAAGSIDGNTPITLWLQVRSASFNSKCRALASYVVRSFRPPA